MGLDGLFALNMDNSDLAITAAGLITLRELKNLGWLGFDAVDASMPNIAALPKLRFLMCQDTTAGDDGFEALSRSRSLEYVWGRRCHNLQARGFKAMAAIPTLRGLSAGAAMLSGWAASTARAMLSGRVASTARSMAGRAGSATRPAIAPSACSFASSRVSTCSTFCDSGVRARGVSSSFLTASTSRT